MIHNKDLPGGEQYKKVDSIHTDTYRNPTLALLLDTANLTFNGVTSVVSFVWNGVSPFRNPSKPEQEFVNTCTAEVLFSGTFGTSRVSCYPMCTTYHVY
jgi:hypothetical protein